MGGADTLIEVDALAADLAGPRPPRLLDVRWPVPWPAGHVSAGPGPADPAAYRAGHLPGAVFVDLDADLAGPPGDGSRGRHPLPDAAAFTAAMRRLGVGAGPVVAYDDGPGFAAARAWWCLRYFGHPAVRVLDGGLAAWRSAGRAVESGDRARPTAGDFSAEPGHLPALDVGGAGGLARLGLLLDARLAERYTGESPVDPVRGHIPGAISAPTFENVGPDGRWHPPFSLRSRYGVLGAEREEVGVYCGSGVTAAHTALAMTIAGLPTPALYVGSWSEWIADPSRPVADGGGARVSGPAPSRAEAEALDAADPLAGFRDRFIEPDPDLIYLDGNSLGRLPRATVDRLREVVEHEWGGGLARSWPDWIDLPTRVGDLIGEHLIGARAGEVIVSDSTTVNLYKLAAAACDARPGRTVLVTDDDNFPTDRYTLDGLARARGMTVRLIASDPVHGPSPADVHAALAAGAGGGVALLSLSAVAYRSGALLDLSDITAAAHEAGALMLWDLCHAAGAVPVDLAAIDADLAVGCGYKYLNGGPGAPAFLYVRRDLQDELRQPIWGWFGQRDQFAMGERYDPDPGTRRFLTGTPSPIGLTALQEGVRMLAEAGLDQLRAKGMALTELARELHEDWLRPLGFELASPADPAARGSHLTLRHPQAFAISKGLVGEANVVPDFRAPDRLRLGPAPISTRYAEVWDALDRLRRLVTAGAHHAYAGADRRVT